MKSGTSSCGSLSSHERHAEKQSEPVRCVGKDAQQDAPANDCPAGCFGEFGVVGWAVMAELDVWLKRFSDLRRVVHEPPHFISSQPSDCGLVHDSDSSKVVGYHESRDLVSALIDHALSFF